MHQANPYTLQLVKQLENENGLTRQRAQLEPVHISEPAVAAPVLGLRGPGKIVRKELANALGNQHDPHITRVLLVALTDPEPGVRWLAAEGLLAIGQPAVMPLLLWLRVQPMTRWLRTGAHQVLHGWLHQHSLDQATEQILTSVLDTLDAIDCGRPCALQQPLPHHYPVNALGNGAVTVPSYSQSSPERR